MVKYGVLGNVLEGRKHCAIEIPTGYGKTVLIALLALALIKKKKECLVAVICVTDYLTSVAYKDYAVKEYSCLLPGEYG